MPMLTAMAAPSSVARAEEVVMSFSPLTGVIKNPGNSGCGQAAAESTRHCGGRCAASVSLSIGLVLDLRAARTGGTWIFGPAFFFPPACVLCLAFPSRFIFPGADAFV